MSCCQKTGSCQPSNQAKGKEEAAPSGAASCCQKSGPCQPSSQHAQGQGDKMGEGQEEVWGAVQNYYGEEVKSRQDLQTTVCEKTTSLSPAAKKALSEVHPEVIARYYGCGLVIPEALEGCSVLDLGSGTGRDCFVVSKLVTASGKVVGVDMTPQQLAVARQYVDYHREKFGFSQPNVEFLQGHIEKLGEAGLQDNAFDIIISNCVINLCPDKGAVLKEAFRVLKEGGELYFSDVYTDTNLTQEIRQHRVLWGECVSGALHWQELYSLAEKEGFSQPRLVSAAKYNTDKFTDILGGAQFVSATYRLFKMPPNPTSTSRPPAVVTYKGGIEEAPDCFQLDGQTTFQKDCRVSVDGELAAILSSSRFQPFFTFDSTGDIIPTTCSPKVDPFQTKLGEVSLCCP